MQHAKLKYVLFILLTFLTLGGRAESVREDRLQGDAVDTLDIRVEVLVASEGEEVYSAMGHTALRIACPTLGTDYVFSYEMDDMQGWAWGMVCGTKKGRTCAIPTSQYIHDKASQGRGVKSYRLNLPNVVRYRLWTQMDERLKYSPQRYDVGTSSCGTMVYKWVMTAMDADSVQTHWPEIFNVTPYEAGSNQITDPWYQFLLLTYMQGTLLLPSADNVNKVVSPAYMLEAFRATTAYGRPLLAKEPQTMAQQKTVRRSYLITPFYLSLFLLLIAFVNLWLRNGWVCISLLAIGSLIGLLGSYAVLTGFYRGSEWNVLVIPFFPLLLPLWKWRRLWAMPMAVISMLWVIAMLASPVALVAPAHIVLGATVVLVYFEISKLKTK